MSQSNDALFKKQGRSRAGLIREAERVRLPARILVSGEPSAGKTDTALRMAALLVERWAVMSNSPAGRVVLIDTEIANGDGEQGASQNYAETHKFKIVPFTPPYHPLDLVATLDDLAADLGPGDCVVLDSSTPFWRSAQGILGLVGDNSNKTFNRWNPAREIQSAFVARVKSMPCHIILTAKAKDKHVRTDDDNGVTISNEGLVPIQDADLPYEMAASLMMVRATHGFKVEKLNAPIAELESAEFGPDGWVEFIETLSAWLFTGYELVAPEQATRITAALNRVASSRDRVRLKQLFKETFRGSPDALPAARGAEAETWVETMIGELLDGMGLLNPDDDLDPDDEIGLGALVTEPLRIDKPHSAPAAAVTPPPEPDPVPAPPRKASKVPEVPAAEIDGMSDMDFFSSGAPVTAANGTAPEADGGLGFSLEN